MQGGYGFPTRFYAEQGFKITSPFGPRRDPFDLGKTVFHTGIDYGGRPTGTAVLSTTAGAVFTAKEYSGWGKLVGVIDSRQFNHFFAHLDSIAVLVGQKIVRGEKVGAVGSTGKATGPHLHYQINKPGAGVNSSGYFGDPDKYFFESEVVAVDNAIVLGSDADYFNAAPLRDRLNCPLFMPSALGELAKVATIYLCGGEAELVKRAAPNAKLVNLSGGNRFETAANIAAYLRTLAK